MRVACLLGRGARTPDKRDLQRSPSLWQTQSSCFERDSTLLAAWRRKSLFLCCETPMPTLARWTFSHVTTSQKSQKSQAQHGSKANSHTIDGKSWKGVTQAQMTAFRYSCPSFSYLFLFLFLFFLSISVLCGCLLADDHRTITKNMSRQRCMRVKSLTDDTRKV